MTITEIGAFAGELVLLTWFDGQTVCGTIRSARHYHGAFEIVPRRGNLPAHLLDPDKVRSIELTSPMDEERDFAASQRDTDLWLSWWGALCARVNAAFGIRRGHDPTDSPFVVGQYTVTWNPGETTRERTVLVSRTRDAADPGVPTGSFGLSISLADHVEDVANDVVAWINRG